MVTQNVLLLGFIYSAFFSVLPARLVVFCTGFAAFCIGFAVLFSFPLSFFFLRSGSAIGVQEKITQPSGGTVI